MTLRRTALVALALALLGATLALMIDDALHAGDWPGWDEGWAILVFPLGIPPAIAAGLRVLRRKSPDALEVAGLTAAVWCWGALVFLVWLAVG